MSLPTQILFPVDFSERTRVVWPAVADMARQLDAEITVLHVLDTGHMPDHLGRELVALTHDKLQNFPLPAAGLRLRRETVQGHPARTIVEHAEALAHPLIMMPTRGQTRFRDLLLGSVTTSVLHDATCPVWTDAHAEDHIPHTGPYRSLVCAVDLGPHTAGILTTACSLATKFAARLHIVHAIPGIDPHFPSPVAERAHAYLKYQAEESYPAHCRAAGISLPLEVIEDVNITDCIVGAVKHHHADLLIIGRGSIQGTLGRLRTNAHQLIRQSPCAVLSV